MSYQLIGVHLILNKYYFISFLKKEIHKMLSRSKETTGLPRIATKTQFKKSKIQLRPTSSKLEE